MKKLTDFNFDFSKEELSQIRNIDHVFTCISEITTVEDQRSAISKVLNLHSSLMVEIIRLMIVENRENRKYWANYHLDRLLLSSNQEDIQH